MVFLLDGIDYLFNLTELSLLQRVSSQCFPVAIIADNLLENLEIFELILSSTDSDVLITESMSSTTISILNDDGKDSLSLSLSLSSLIGLYLYCSCDGFISRCDILWC